MVTALEVGSLHIELYDLFFALGSVGAFLYLTTVCKHYSISKWKAILFTLLVYSSTLVWMYFLYWADSGFTAWGGNNIVRVYWWLGVFVFPVSRLLKLDYLKCLDFVSPCLCICHGVAHFGCIFAGCCHGYPCAWGIYNPQIHTTCFPIQPLEALIDIEIAVFIALRERKKQYGKGIDGLSFPIMLMLFGYSRFFLEFLRDNEKLFWGISGLALHALLNALIGTIACLYIRKRHSRRISV